MTDVDKSSLLAVNEIFGPTIQGEGPSLGTPCVFLRLAGCNLHCTWCDTKYTWDWETFDPKKEVHSMQAQDIVTSLSDKFDELPFGLRLLVVSGGEPLLQGVRLSKVLSQVLRMGVRAEIETAGTINPPAELLQFYPGPLRFNVSPKLEHSGNSLQERYRVDVLRHFDRLPNTVFKFVVQKEQDLDEVYRIKTDLRLSSPIYIMPEGVIASDWMAGKMYWEAIVGKAIRMGFNFTPRLHILLYGNKRGV